MFAEVIVDVVNKEVDKIFDYIVPQNLNVIAGTMVLLPFGNRTVEGFVLSLKESSLVPKEKQKSIISVISEKQLITTEMLQLAKYMKNVYHLKMVDILRLMLPSQIRLGKVKDLTIKNIKINNDFNFVNNYLNTLKANAKKQKEIIEFFINNDKISIKKSDLAESFSKSAIETLIKENVLIQENVKQNREPLKNIESNYKSVVLNEYQQNAVNKILEKPKTYLLHGVTGSGKTEVYMNVINNVLKQNKNVIMLVPEIGLTPQVMRQFKARFGNLVALIHSGLSDGEKFDEWFKILNKEARIVVGARSAIFSPIENLGAIIIDEEHDNSYISDSNPRYSTHEVAEFRKNYNICPLILGSATPNIDSYFKAKNNEYELLELPKRANNKELPKIQIVDMCKEFRGGNTTPFSEDLMEKLNQTIANNNQCILFINRRGFSNFVMCQNCGYIPKCTSCDVSLSVHKDEHQLKCHYCGKKFKLLTKCPMCGSEHLKYGGVGTQQVVNLLKEKFPNVSIFRMDNDTTKTKDSHAKILSDFEKSKPAILVGTQMIAKGHDFPYVTLVGILDADLSLFMNDYRSTEKTFQLITQVAGRAGRSDKTGEVVLQTYFPKHYVYNLVANYDYIRFYEKEINLRQTTLFPPFSKIVRLLITSEKEDDAKNATHNLFLNLKELRMHFKEDVYFLEAMKSPIGRIKNKYRFQIVLRFANNNDIINEIFNLVDRNQSKSVTIFVETNPLSLS